LVRRGLVDAAAIVAVWAGLLLAENVVVSLAWGEQFSGAWELTLVRRLVAPLALLGLAPLSLAVVAGWGLARCAADGSRAARTALGMLGAIAAAAVGVGVTGGRHFAGAAGWALRGALVALLAAAGWALGALVVTRVRRWGARPAALALLGAGVCAAAWLGDEYVLPRLYPAFHAGLFAATLLGAALVGLALRADAPVPSWGAQAFAGMIGLAVAGCALWAPRAARELESLANVRITLVEHAPVLGRAVIVVTRLRAPASEDAPGAAASFTPGEVARALDWTGHDLLLVSIDALRADHVSAYGYARPTTPSLDALAREGTLFEAAYCPTPHTSYSVTSMMTGKYLRPLLGMGLGEDSETWAQDLRRYGWRTAAFYPPAVFFIDEDRFPRFEGEHLGFEYAKVEFADPALREQQVGAYLDGAPRDRPLFLWVHFFEPHEPYVPHPEHVFAGGPSADVDAYDGEVAAADDGVGRIVKMMRARRPGAAIVVTADHGEEFGEHGGRYHGTTVYEEQVRVPLVVAGPGVRAGARVATAVQTIDLLPTALSALGMPRPARVRGRDLGPLLAGGAADPGLAFAETDDYALIASGGDRLVCERRAAACALYRPRDDPQEKHDVARDDPAAFDRLRALLRAVERDHGRYEATAEQAWPEAIRRGLQGEADAAVDVAALLDDADVAIRRKAGEVCFALHVPATAPELRRALARDEDEEVRRWAALALARVLPSAGEGPRGDLPPAVDAMLKDASRDWRRRAALALGERGEARACDELAAWWEDVAPSPGAASPDGEPPRLGVDLAHAEELLGATSRARCRGAVPALLRALDDVRARPYVADALGAIGDERARRRLLELLAVEPYVTTRPHEAAALLELGARDWAAAEPAAEVAATLAAPAGEARLVVLVSDRAAALEAHLDSAPLVADCAEGEVRVFPVSRVGQGSDGSVPDKTARKTVRVELGASSGGVRGVWLLPAARLD
jgi:arylsulfatase A-like enzyme